LFIESQIFVFGNKSVMKGLILLTERDFQLYSLSVRASRYNLQK